MAKAEKILVVNADGEASRRITSALALVRVGGLLDAEVTSAATLAGAMKALGECSASLIFASLELPDSKGLDTLRILRGRCADAPIIVFVPADGHAAGAAALGAGAQDYLYDSESRSDVLERSIVRAMERKKVEERHADTGWRSGIGQTTMSLRHEINNPLASLMLNLEMLKEGGHDDADELLQGIEIAAKRIAAVVRRLEGLKTPQRIPAIGGEAMVDLSGDKVVLRATDHRTAGGEGALSPSDARTILLVDDEESVRAIVLKILTRHGHRVLEAEHGAAALRLAAEYAGKIDLLVTDMYMPGLRGPEILETLRQARPEVKVLFMSGYGDEDVARSGVEPGSTFLRKPFTVEELSEAVQKALGDTA